MSVEQEWAPSWAVVGQGMTSSEAAAEALNEPVDQAEPVRVQHDVVDHPAHYTSGPRCECGRVIECIVVTERMSFSVGNAIKYLWRLGLKGDPIEQLRKARWYLDREIARRERDMSSPTQSDDVVSQDDTDRGMSG